MDYLKHNRLVWNRQSSRNCIWSLPVDSSIVAKARQGEWKVLLTPSLPVPRSWFGDLRGRRVLCLASGGGQQAPVLAAAGARVVSFDLSEEQLAKDAMVAERDGLPIDCVQGNMTDLSCFGDGCFDLVFHPSANSFVADVRPVWRECHRVLRGGGALLAGFNNPAVFLFDHDEADRTGTLVVKHGLPYADATSLSAQALAQRREKAEPLQFSHSLDEQIGGQIEAGFAIVGFYEDRSTTAGSSARCHRYPWRPARSGPQSRKAPATGIQHIMQTDETISDKSPAFNFMRAPAPLLPRPPG